MKRNKFGRIVQIGSEVVELGNPQFANYAVLQKARSLARHGRGRGNWRRMESP